MHPKAPNLNKTVHSKVTIFHIADKILKYLKQAQDTYFITPNLPKFNFGRLYQDQQGIYVYPFQPKSGIFLDEVEFLEKLKDVLLSKSEKLSEDKNRLEVVLSIRREKIQMKILKNIERENHAYSLKIESSIHGILKVVLKQTHTSSLQKRIQNKIKEKSYAKSIFEEE